MNELFDRPVIILETDRSKSDDGHATAHPSRNLLSPALARTKYIDALLSQLTRSKIQVSSVVNAITRKEIYKDVFRILVCPKGVICEAELSVKKVGSILWKCS